MYVPYGMIVGTVAAVTGVVTEDFVDVLVVTLLGSYASTEEGEKKPAQPATGPAAHLEIHSAVADWTTDTTSSRHGQQSPVLTWLENSPGPLHPLSDLLRLWQHSTKAAKQLEVQSEVYTTKGLQYTATGSLNQRTPLSRVQYAV